MCLPLKDSSWEQTVKIADSSTSTAAPVVRDPYWVPTSDDIDPKSGKTYSQNQIKKLKKKSDSKRKKHEATKRRAEEAAERERRKIAESKEIEITENPDLPEAIKIHVKDIKQHVGERVRICGWVHFVRFQKANIFVDLRDGTGLVDCLIQCLLSGDLAKCYGAITLHREAAVEIFGVLKEDERSRTSHIELQVDYFTVIGPADGEATTRMGTIKSAAKKQTELEDSTPESQGKREENPAFWDNRHLFIRESTTSLILKLRSKITHCFREHMFAKDFVEITAPTMVQTQVEGGSTLFKFDYYGETAYLTQSSQLYLETTMFSLGNCFVMLPSYRAEKSRTRRHLAEYIHLEAEMPFITFEDLLTYCEDLICDVAERAMAACGDAILSLNPDFKVPQRPIMRMTYREAIDYCQTNNIYKDEEKQIHFEFGDDIPEGPERKMTQMVGEPILLCKFHCDIKSFYMSRCAEDEILTESVDLLMPGVGEIIGGSMREWSYEKLMSGFEKHGIDPSPYYWYTDLRKFGTCPHGGYGLGVERFLCWILGQDHIKKVCLYPRHVDRCKP